MEKLIEAIPDLIESVGVFQTVLLILSLAFVAAMLKGQITKGDTPRQTVQNAVTPLTCAWGEMDRHDLRELRKDVEDIKDRVVRIEDRTGR